MSTNQETEESQVITYAYSASVNMFYIIDMKESFIALGSWPADAIEVEDDVYNEYAAAMPPSGKQRVAGSDGLPSWGDIPAPTHEMCVAHAEWQKQNLIKEAINYMNEKQWAGKAAIGRLSDGELSQYTTWLDYLDALNGVDTELAPDIAWPQKP